MKNILKSIVFICILFTSEQMFAAAAPSNDDCASAITLTVGASCTYATYTTANATQQAGIPAPGCANYLGGEVWFKVTVPASGHLLIDTQTDVITDAGMAIYSGTCPPAGMTLIECDDDDSPNGMMSMIDRTGLTPGSTIWIMVWEYGNDNPGTFGICVSDPPAPANDNCPGTTITPGASCTPTAGTVAGATQTLAGCLGTANDDVWYTFTATNSTQIITVTPSASFDPVVQIFSGACGSLNSIACNDADFLTGTMGQLNVTGLTVGTVYHYRVYDYYTGVPATTTFTTCVTNPPTCPGGLGTGVTNVASLPYVHNNHSTCGNVNDLTSSNLIVCGSTLYNTGEDDVYIFTPATTGSITIGVTSTGSYMGLQLYDGCPFSGGTCSWSA